MLASLLVSSSMRIVSSCLYTPSLLNQQLHLPRFLLFDTFLLSLLFFYNLFIYLFIIITLQQKNLLEHLKNALIIIYYYSYRERFSNALLIGVVESLKL